MQSEEVQKIIHAEQNNIDIHIFVKKDDDEGSGFYYVGKATPDQDSVKQDEMVDKNGKKIPVVHMNMVIEHSIDNNLYHYIINKSFS